LTTTAAAATTAPSPTVTPGPTNAQYYSGMSSGSDYANVRTTDWPWQAYCRDQTTCTLRMAVHGWELGGNSSYIITATPSDNATSLTLGVPHYDHVSSGDLVYFSAAIPVLPSGGQVVQFIVDAFTGDPNLFLSTHTQRPGPGRPRSYVTRRRSKLARRRLRQRLRRYVSVIELQAKGGDSDVPFVCSVFLSLCLLRLQGKCAPRRGG
jgi:hypothetical protein